eukprot:3852122-Prymnesium_polylepis.1
MGAAPVAPPPLLLALGQLGLVAIGRLCGSRAVPGGGGRLRVVGGGRLLRARALVAGLAGR